MRQSRMRWRQELEHAVKASKPTDRFYADSCLSMAELLTGEGKLTEAIQLCREGIDQHPSQELFIKRKLALLLASRPELRRRCHLHARYARSEHGDGIVARLRTRGEQERKLSDEQLLRRVLVDPFAAKLDGLGKFPFAGQKLGH